MKILPSICVGMVRLVDVFRYSRARCAVKYCMHPTVVTPNANYKGK
jgi:hypothetical protein